MNLSADAATNGKSNGLNTYVLNDNLIRIASNGISMPINRIILIHIDKAYCVVFFTDAFLPGYGVYKNDQPYQAYSHYISYQQIDGTGDFSKSNVVFLDDEIFIPEVRRFWAALFGPKRKDTIQCGDVELSAFMTSIAFFTHPDQQFYPSSIYKLGVELAPTPWQSIQQVNVHDQRIKWFKYDELRADRAIPVDQIWPNAPQEQSR